MIFNLGNTVPVYELQISGVPLATVTVSNTKKTYLQTTDAYGKTVFSKLKRGLWSVVVRKGLEEAAYTVNVGRNQGNSLNINAIPEFTYDGAYEIVDDDGNKITASLENWRIRFLTSGTLIFTSLNGAANGIDVFCCGGGGGGGASIAGGGGGGGYTTTVKNKSVALNTEYVITIGSGGGNNASGGNTTAFNVTANGGNPGGWYSASTGSATGGAGGSGGGQYGGTYGGSDGGNGGGTCGGKGQGTTTREFGESSGRLYAGGGSGGLYNKGDTSKWIPAIDESAAGSAQHAPANRGGGGGGSCHTLGPAGGSGGSGIVVIRNKR